jgi:beta-glucanase (GH16 family)
MTWILVWSDDFDGSVVDGSKWTVRTGGYDPDWHLANNVTINNSIMTITAKHESFGGFNYTSGWIYSQHKCFWRYGKIEMRAKMPWQPNLVPAFWMLPETMIGEVQSWDPNREYGEIDIVEIFCDHSNTTIKGTCIYGAPLLDSGIWYDTGVEYSAGFHTYGIEWKPGEIRWTFDGNVFHIVTSWYSTAGDFPHPFDDEFFLIICLQVGSIPPPTTIFPIEMNVDWVKVYTKVIDPYELAVVGTSRVGYSYIDAWAEDASGGATSSDATLFSAVNSDAEVSTATSGDVVSGTATGGDSG